MISENDKNEQIIGSAEPLSKEETRERLEDLARWGVDLTLVSACLDRSPTERITRMLALLNLSKELRRAYIAQVPKAQNHFNA